MKHLRSKEKKEKRRKKESKLITSERAVRIHTGSFLFFSFCCFAFS